MKKYKYFLPYDISLKYEIETYKNVGMDYGNRKTANLGLAFNFMRWRRKRKNKNEKHYKTCNTYSEWERHILDILPKEKNDINNLLHFLEKKKVNAEVAYESTKSILIPIYIALLALCNLFSDNKKVQIIFVVVCIIMTMRNALPELRGNRLEIEFYNDFISIVEKELILVNN